MSVSTKHAEFHSGKESSLHSMNPSEQPRMISGNYEQQSTFTAPIYDMLDKQCRRAGNSGNMKDSSINEKDTFWWFKQIMIHSLFDKIINIEYGQDSNIISMDEDSSNDAHDDVNDDVSVDVEDDETKESETESDLQRHTVESVDSDKKNMPDYLLKRLLFPYDSNLFERAAKKAPSKPEVERKGKLTEISHNVKKPPRPSATKTAAERQQKSCCVRKRGHGCIEYGASPSEAVSCSVCTDTNKRFRGTKPPSLTHSPIVVEPEPAVTTQIGELKEQRMAGNTESSDTHLETVTKSDIVNLIIQRIYLEDEKSEMESKCKDSPCGDPVQCSPTKQSPTKTLVKLEAEQPIVNVQLEHVTPDCGTGCHPAPLQPKYMDVLAAHHSPTCDTSVDTECDNLLTKYKKYPIANKSRHASRSSPTLGEQPLGSSVSSGSSPVSSSPCRGTPISDPEHTDSSEQAIDLTNKASNTGRT